MSATEPAAKKSRYLLTDWNPNDESKWDSKLAWRTLWITTYSLVLAFSVWFRSIFTLHPQAHLMADVPLSFKLHIIAGLLLFCIWPFTRLVHAVSAPVGYVARPPVVYRSRDERREHQLTRGGMSD